MSEPTCVAALDCVVWTLGLLAGVTVALVGGPGWTWAALLGTFGSTIVSKQIAWSLARGMGWASPDRGPRRF